MLEVLVNLRGPSRLVIRLGAIDRVAIAAGLSAAGRRTVRVVAQFISAANSRVQFVKVSAVETVLVKNRILLAHIFDLLIS